jgi:hypothetical protein
VGHGPYRARFAWAHGPWDTVPTGRGLLGRMDRETRSLPGKSGRRHACLVGTVSHGPPPVRADGSAITPISGASVAKSAFLGRGWTVGHGPYRARFAWAHGP